VTTVIAVTLCIGVTVGLLFGIFMATVTGLTRRVATMIGSRILHEHRAYRLALAKQVGSTREADQLMSVYRRDEVL
jgi:hypothetical protein